MELSLHCQYSYVNKWGKAIFVPLDQHGREKILRTGYKNKELAVSAPNTEEFLGRRVQIKIKPKKYKFVTAAGEYREGISFSLVDIQAISDLTK